MKRFVNSSALLKMLSLVMAFTIAIGMFVSASGVAVKAEYEIWNGSSAQPAVGDGSSTNPYQISNGAELKWVASLSEEDSKDKFFVITEDIYLNNPESADITYDANGYVNAYSLKKWPSGSSSDYSLNAFGVFSGNIDGQGHTVFGLNNSWAPNGNWGLFGTLGGGATIKNINIDSSFYKRNNTSSWSNSNTFAGGIAGDTIGGSITISGCTVYRSTITEQSNGWANLCGILARNKGYGGVEIINCGADVKLGTMSHNQFASGGIIGDGWTNPVIIRNCWSNIYLAGNNNTNGNHGATYTNCYTLNTAKNISVTGNVPTGITVVSGSVKGESAREVMRNLGWDTNWRTVENANPMPIISASGEAPQPDPFAIKSVDIVNIPEFYACETAMQAIDRILSSEDLTPVCTTDNVRLYSYGISEFCDIDADSFEDKLIMGETYYLQLGLYADDEYYFDYHCAVTADLNEVESHIVRVQDDDVLFVCVPFVVGAPQMNFPDVIEGEWYYEAVEYAVGTGIFKGYGNGLFGTSDSIQRQDFLVMLARYDGVDLAEYAAKNSAFGDVPEGSYYESAVNWGSENGIVTGYEDGHFGVGDTITREQMVTFLYRYADYIVLDTSVKDADAVGIMSAYEDFTSVSAFAKNAVLWALDRGVISGKTPTTIVPQGNAQRCEVAKVMLNIERNDIFVSSFNKALYAPHSLTVSLYDAVNNTYGFTWNTQSLPLKSVLQICEGKSFNKNSAQEYEANVETMSNLHISKVEVTLVAGKTYSYRIYDTKAKTGSDVYKITAKNPNSNKITFAHLSDSQVDMTSQDAGKPFGKVLSAINSRHPDIDFLLHTGDVVQYGGRESDWRNMLNPNINLVSSMPIMAISGNHETSQYGGNSHHTYKHFNVKKPSQNCATGYYYSFDYGPARFIMLNTNLLSSNKLTTEQYNWLVSTLQSNTKQWTIVAMHNPLYSVGKWGASSSYNAVALALQGQLSDLFSEYEVDLVLQGHDHAYSYTYPITTNKTALKNAAVDGDHFVNPQGVIYSMHGPVGNQSRGPHRIDNNLYKYAATGIESSWAEITIDGNTLTVDVLNCSSGSPKIEFSYGIKK